MTTDTVGGVWNYSVDLASALLHDQVNVTLLAMGPVPDQGQQAQVSQLENVTFHHLPCQLEWMDDPWSDVEKAGEWIKRIYYQELPDIIHFNHYAHVSLGWECPVVLVAHSCVASWWHEVKKEALPDRYNRYFQMVKEAMHTADVVVSPTAEMLNLYEEIYGNLKNGRVIYNGLEIPAEMSGRVKQPVIFSMGRIWDEAKNINLLIEAARNIRGKIYIAGDKDKTRFKTLPSNVMLLGQITRQEVYDWLKISSIYVLPVKYEPFGLSFLEAGLNHCALIGGNIPTLHELWDNSMTYTSTGKATELAKKCNQLLADRQYCSEMGRKAHNRVQRYSLEKKKNHYLNLYTNMQVTA